jgi:antitoxin (DNA-binding transcriptional repressor) of toxin-antitoxin stability system
MTVGEFKSHFSDVIDWVKSGKKVAVTFGKKKEIVGYFVPQHQEREEKRKLGLLKGQATVHFKDDFKITEEEFLAE